MAQHLEAEILVKSGLLHMSLGNVQQDEDTEKTCEKGLQLLQTALALNPGNESLRSMLETLLSTGEEEDS